MRREVLGRRTTKFSAGPPPSEPISDGVVTLRVPLAEDVDRLVQYGLDPELLEGVWIVGPRGTNVKSWAEGIIAEMAAGWTDAGGEFGGGLVIDELEPCVGTVDFIPRGDRVVELVVGVAPPARGRGVASRAVQLAADWALTDGDFDRVELRVAEANAASKRIADKAGFQLVERFETFVEGTGLTHLDLRYERARSNADTKWLE